MAVTFPISPANGTIVTDTATGQSWKYDSTKIAWLKIAASSGSFVNQLTAITLNGQTVFTLLFIPANAAMVSMNVNGVDYFPPDFSVAGTLVTWAGPMTLATTDTLYIQYQI